MSSAGITNHYCLMAGRRMVGRIKEEHRGAVHFTWDFTVDGAPVLSGRDFVVLAPDGRIQSITGFYPPPVT